MNTIRIRPEIPTASGRRRGWTKHVTGLNPGQRGGYALEGYFLNNAEEVDLPVGAILVEVSPEGSVKNGWQSATVYQLQIDGSMTELASGNWREDFLSLRDAIAEALDDTDDDTNPLANFSDDDLLAEIQRRGIASNAT